MSPSQAPPGTIPPEQTQGTREVAGRVLDALLAAGLCALVVVPTLLQSSSLTDNFLGKNGAALTLSGLTVAIWMATAAVRGRLRVDRSPLFLPFALLVGVSMISLSQAQNVWRGAEVLLTQVLLFATCVIVAQRYGTGRARTLLVWTMVGTGLVVSLIGILQYNGVHLVPLPEYYGNYPISTLGNPNFVAHYLELIIPLSTALLLWGRRPWWQRLILSAVLAATGFHLLLTASRGGWLATCAGLLVLALVAVPRGRWVSTAVLVVVVGALLSPVVEMTLRGVSGGNDGRLYTDTIHFVERTWNHVLSSFDASNYSRRMRVVIWEDTLRLIGSQPYLGVGPGNYEFSLPAYRTVVNHRLWRDLTGVRRNEPYFAHNEYLEFWAEIGPLGMAAALWLMGVLLWLGWGRARLLRRGQKDGEAVEADRQELAITAGAVASIAAALVHACFSFNLQDAPPAVHFWLLGGLVVAGHKARDDGGRPLFDLSLRRISAPAVGVVATGGVLGLAGIYAGGCILVADYLYFSYHQALADERPKEALTDLQRAIDWRPHEFRHLHELGRVRLIQKRPIDAEVVLRQSLELHPNDKGALRLIGRSLIDQQRGAEAVGYLKRAKLVDPLHWETYRLLAAAQRQYGDFEGVVETRKQALSFRPEDPALMMSLGLAYKEAGRLEEAVIVLERAASLKPRDGLIQGNLSAVYLLLGRLPEAETASRAAIREDVANRVEWRFNLAKALMLQGRLAEALREVDAALLEAPDNPRVQQLEQRLKRQKEKTE